MPLFFLQFALYRFKAVARPGNPQLVKTNSSEKNFRKVLTDAAFYGIIHTQGNGKERKKK